jgi:ABC-type polysaccharide/polyol phosphate transport system ATPase subunit
VQHVITGLCNKALWLDGGKVVAYDDVDRVLNAYSKRDPSLLAQPAADPGGAAAPAAS